MAGGGDSLQLQQLADQIKAMVSERERDGGAPGESPRAGDDIMDATPVEPLDEREIKQLEEAKMQMRDIETLQSEELSKMGMKRMDDQLRAFGTSPRTRTRTSRRCNSCSAMPSRRSWPTRRR